jgi:hypothetical protein
MNRLLIMLAFLSCATCAEAAEAWTCTYTVPIGSGTVSDPVLTRFEVSPPDLIEAKHHHHYRILQNNDFGLVAASSISEIEEAQKDPTVGAFTVVINKRTGEFWLSTTIAGQAAVVNQPVHGKCLKD